ncbi:MAG TPA: hypothetical protein V6C72_03305, partial [Chroococcales cyanobacterium]
MTALVADAPVRKRLPLWASTLASLVVVTVIAIIAGAYGIFYYVEILSERAHDPSYIKATAAKIADFPEPLPEGYEMKAAIDLDFFHFAMVAMVNKKDHQAISICAMSPASADPK